MGPELGSALVGAIIGGIVAAAIFLGQREQTRWQATMAILAEFNSPQWLSIRSGAYEALCRCPDQSPIMMRDTKALLDREERDRIWAVLTFYARLCIMLDGKYVVRRTILPAFGEVFFWWWEFYFSHIRQASHLSELTLVRRLHDMFERDAAALNNPGMLRPWREEGRSSRRALGLPMPEEGDGAGEGSRPA